MTMLCVTHEMGFAKHRRQPGDLHGRRRDRRAEQIGFEHQNYILVSQNTDKGTIP
jgi:hypothetical protein